MDKHSSKSRLWSLLSPKPKADTHTKARYKAKTLNKQVLGKKLLEKNLYCATTSTALLSISLQAAPNTRSAQRQRGAGPAGQLGRPAELSAAAAPRVPTRAG